LEEAPTAAPSRVARRANCPLYNDLFTRPGHPRFLGLPSVGVGGVYCHPCPAHVSRELQAPGGSLRSLDFPRSRTSCAPPFRTTAPELMALAICCFLGSALRTRQVSNQNNATQRERGLLK